MSRALSCVQAGEPVRGTAPKPKMGGSAFCESNGQVVIARWVRSVDEAP